MPMLVGIVTSGIAGWIAVWGTLKLVRTHSFMPFVIYRVALVWWSWWSWRPAGGTDRFMAPVGG